MRPMDELLIRQGKPHSYKALNLTSLSNITSRQIRLVMKSNSIIKTTNRVIELTVVTKKADILLLYKKKVEQKVKQASVHYKQSGAFMRISKWQK